MAGCNRYFAVALVAAAFAVAVAATACGVWEYADAAMTLATMAFAGLAWWQTRKAREATYRGSGTQQWVVALEVGRPVSEAVKAQFGQLDCLVRPEAIIGGNTLATPEDYRRMAEATYAAVCAGQTARVKLVLSGPVALACVIGQLVGLHHFDVEVFQWDAASKQYAAVPSPTRDWLDHRS